MMMIEIRCNRTKHVFRYGGNITIDMDDPPFLTITSDGYIRTEEDGLPITYQSTIDKFWPQDIVSIVGKDR